MNGADAASSDEDLEGLANPAERFLEAASVDRYGWHSAGTVEYAERILSRYPEAATASIHAAAVLGDADRVRELLGGDRSLATARGGPFGWDALTYLCFSRYLRIDGSRSEAFVAAARELLEAGADANTGWTNHIDDPPRPVLEAAIYGAAGIARHPGLTRLLLEFGADPNDEETPYHVPETGDNGVLEILLASGRLSRESMVTLLLRKADWHDEEGLRLALEHGADPNLVTRFGVSGLEQAVRRDNSVKAVETLLDHGADPRLRGGRAIAMAARRGRGDLLELFERRGVLGELPPLDALIALCARGAREAVRELGTRDPALLEDLRAVGGRLLSEFAGNGDLEGVRCLLDLGVPVSAVHGAGDAYWEVTKGTTALHNAAWRAQHELVRELIARGAPVGAPDSEGRTPLALAVRACVDSYWTRRRRPDSVRALLAAGARPDGINLPTGYEAIDALLLPPGEPGTGGTL